MVKDFALQYLCYGINKDNVLVLIMTLEKNFFLALWY